MRDCRWDVNDQLFIPMLTDHNSMRCPCEFATSERYEDHTSTLLSYAIWMLNSEELVEWLITIGADMNLVSCFVKRSTRYQVEHGTPLIIATSLGVKGHKFGRSVPCSIEIIEVLLRSGADPNITCQMKNGDVVSPLICACQLENIEQVQMLLEHGADPNLLSPLHTAIKLGNESLVELLLDYGADSEYQIKGQNALSLAYQLDRKYIVYLIKKRLKSKEAEETAQIRDAKMKGEALRSALSMLKDKENLNNMEIIDLKEISEELKEILTEIEQRIEANSNLQADETLSSQS